jgi:shikimate dehydrogenase
LKRLAVIGYPVAHSRSPAMHTAAFEALGIDDEWSYGAIEMSPEDFPRAAAALPADGYVGANVTVPHKQAALAISDEASDVAREIDAANTLSFRDGRIHADNTDAPGFLASLPESPRGSHALVLGAGGAARAVVWALVSEGAEVSVWNRTPGRAQELAADLGARALPSDERRATSDASVDAAAYDLVVNATSVGMQRATADNQVAPSLKPLPIDADDLHERQVVVDLVYASGETDLAQAARSRGATVVDGLEVLVRQGAESFRIWTGLAPPLEAMRMAAKST